MISQIFLSQVLTNSANKNLATAFILLWSIFPENKGILGEKGGNYKQNTCLGFQGSLCHTNDRQSCGAAEEPDN